MTAISILTDPDQIPISSTKRVEGPAYFSASQPRRAPRTSESRMIGLLSQSVDISLTNLAGFSNATMVGVAEAARLKRGHPQNEKGPLIFGEPERGQYLLSGTGRNRPLENPKPATSQDRDRRNR
jgi:hypothetical protein